MALLKIRDSNGNVQEILAIKGDKGEDYVLTDADKEEITTSVVTKMSPEMLAGVEYLTTERFLGRPVYTKILDGNPLINDTVLTLGGPHDIVRFNGWIRDSNRNMIHVLPYINGTLDDDHSAWLSVDGYTGAISIYCGTGLSDNGYTFDVQIWYAK